MAGVLAMPARQPPESAESRAVREVEEEDQAVMAKLAAEAGPPTGSDKLSEADEDEAWETEDGQVDPETFATMLMTQGLPPEVAQKLLVVKLRPDWLPLYGQPTQDAEQADMLTKLARWPFRLSVIEDIDDPDEMVRKAETLDRRYQKRRTVAQEQEAQPRMTVPGGAYRGMEGY